MRRWFCLTFLALLGAAPLLQADDAAARVIVVANQADDDSVRIARHYAEARGIPAANIMLLPMSRAETITWPEFVQSIWDPLQQMLIAAHWIDAIPMNLRDEVGRRKCAFSGHRISYLVLCRGVPLRITHEASLFAPVPPVTDNPSFRTNAAAVDSELALLAHANHPINAFVWNPLFADEHPSRGERGEIISVSRLDGPSPSDAMQLVDRAIAAERTGLIGRAYIDLGGNHPDGDRWLQAAAQQLTELGFDVAVDHSPGPFPIEARFDAPALYFGWYASEVTGPFLLPGFRFPVGAIALHIHSYSAQSVRTADQFWVGPLVARGVTATVGNVFEPFLQLTHRPDLLLRALANGERWGDAVVYAQPAMSWQTVAIGDPLYRPFTVGLELQWDNRRRLDNRELGYVVVRRMLQLEASRKDADALALGARVQLDRPSLALGRALGERLGDGGAGALDVLASIPPARSWQPDEWVLVHDAADVLARGGQAAQSLALLRPMLNSAELPRDFRRRWLGDGIRAATAVHEKTTAAEWQRQLDALNAGAGTPQTGSR